MLRSNAHQRFFVLKSSLFALLPACLLFSLLVACGSSHSAAPVTGSVTTPSAAPVTTPVTAPVTPSTPLSTPSAFAMSAPPLPVLVGDTGQLTAQAMWSDGSSSNTSDQTTWQSSVPGIVNIGVGGAFTAQAVGATTITASFGGFTSTAAISVTDHFTVISIPDTQYMVAQTRGGSLDMMRSEFNWIKDHRVTDNIRVVAGEGDIVDSGNLIQQWKDADSVYQILDASTIPYASVMGNHDYDIGGSKAGADRASHNYNQYFGPQRFAGRPWYGQSTFPAGQSDNFYVTLDVGTRHYMVLALEFLPRPEAIPWAQSILDAHPGYQVILLTHAYVDNNGHRNTYSPSGFPSYGLSTANATDGVELWDKLIRINPSIIAVLSGHFTGADAHLDDANDKGGLVAQIEADFQFDNRGGSGMLRVLKFYPGQNRIDVSSFSPYFKQSVTSSIDQFSTFYGTPAK